MNVGAKTNYETIVNPLLSIKRSYILKGALSSLKQYLAIESPLKMMKNAFHFTSKAFFVLKIFNFLSWLFGHVTKHLDWKGKIDIKFCEPG